MWNNVLSVFFSSWKRWQLLSKSGLRRKVYRTTFYQINKHYLLSKMHKTTDHGCYHLSDDLYHAILIWLFWLWVLVSARFSAVQPIREQAHISFGQSTARYTFLETVPSAQWAHDIWWAHKSSAVESQCIFPSRVQSARVLRGKVFLEGILPP